MPEITGSGGALFDFDNDGDLDVYLVQSNVLEPNIKPNATMFPWRGAEPPRGKLFRNNLIHGSGALESGSSALQRRALTSAREAGRLSVAARQPSGNVE